jgi:hypothetical protein
MSQARASNETIPAYLVPTPAGARYVLNGREPDPRRLVLSALLRGGSSRPMPLAMLADISGLPDRKALGTILFQLQRDNWLTGDIEPLTVAREPLGEAVPPLLQGLSVSGQGVLADDNGLCYAYSGYARDEADRLAAFSTGLFPLWRLYQELPEFATKQDPTGWTLVTGQGETRLTICPLFVGDQVLHMTLAGTAGFDCPAYVKLAALLLRRYVGSC